VPADAGRWLFNLASKSKLDMYFYTIIHPGDLVYLEKLLIESFIEFWLRDEPRRRENARRANFHVKTLGRRGKRGSFARPARATVVVEAR